MMLSAIFSPEKHERQLKCTSQLGWLQWLVQLVRVFHRFESNLSRGLALPNQMPVTVINGLHRQARAWRIR